jgi:Domain of unknown function (DUF4388)
MKEGGASGEWAQGTLRLIGPRDLLQLLARTRFSGRLVLISGHSPRRVVALHLDAGEPCLAVGSGLPQVSSVDEESFRARQLLLDALTWRTGTFRAEGLDENTDVVSQRQTLGTVGDLLAAAKERAVLWPRLLERLPAPYDEIMVVPGSWQTLPSDPTQLAVLQVLEKPTALGSIPHRCGIDEHRVVQAVLTLAERQVLALRSAAETLVFRGPELDRLVPQLLEELCPKGEDRSSLKITVLSWDARTCFRTVEALLGRLRPVPADVEEQPRYHILHESAPLAAGPRLEVLGFRADTFEPELAAPLVQNCHIFLLVTDMEAGHVWGADAPLAERINALRTIFKGAMVAGRITIGAGAVTDPGCDVIIPELARYISWKEVESAKFLPAVLEEVANRLGMALTEEPTTRS